MPLGKVSDPDFVRTVQEAIEREGRYQNIRTLQGREAEINLIFCPLCNEQMTWRIEDTWLQDVLHITYVCSKCGIRGYLAARGTERRLTPEIRTKIVQKVRYEHGSKKEGNAGS